MVSKTISPINKRPQVQTKTGLSKSTIYAKLDPESRQYDPSFPRPISLGARAVGWLSHEIDEWIASRQRCSSINVKGSSHE